MLNDDNNTPNNSLEFEGTYHKGKALIGWMNPEQARLCLVRQRADQSASPEQEQLIQLAHAAAASRPTLPARSDVVEDAPVELANHIDALRKSPIGSTYFSEGYRVVTVDLTGVCAVQPTVLSAQ